MAAPKAHPKWGGRKQGTRNKATAEIRELAQACAPAAIAELARLCLHAKTEATRVAAIKEILDRGYGKPTQPIAGDPGYGAIEASIALRPQLSRDEWLALVNAPPLVAE